MEHVTALGADKAVQLQRCKISELENNNGTDIWFWYCEVKAIFLLNINIYRVLEKMLFSKPKAMTLDVQIV